VPEHRGERHRVGPGLNLAGRSGVSQGVEREMADAACLESRAVGVRGFDHRALWVMSVREDKRRAFLAGDF